MTTRLVQRIWSKNASAWTDDPAALRQIPTALGWLGVPVLRDGVMLQLPNMTLEVADECSSVPAIVALLALGAAYSQLQARPTWMRAVLTLAAAPLGLLSNIVRLILTSLSAYYFGPIALNNLIHKFNGTTVFLATVVLLVVLDGLLTRIWRRASVGSGTNCKQLADTAASKLAGGSSR